MRERGVLEESEGKGDGDKETVRKRLSNGRIREPAERKKLRNIQNLFCEKLV